MYEGYMTELPRIRPIKVARKSKGAAHFIIEWVLGGIMGIVLGAALLHFFCDIPIQSLWPF